MQAGQAASRGHQSQRSHRAVDRDMRPSRGRDRGTGRNWCGHRDSLVLRQCEPPGQAEPRSTSAQRQLQRCGGSFPSSWPGSAFTLSQRAGPATAYEPIRSRPRARPARCGNAGDMSPGYVRTGLAGSVGDPEVRGQVRRNSDALAITIRPTSRASRRAVLRWSIAESGDWFSDVGGECLCVRWLRFLRQVVAVALHYYRRYGRPCRDAGGENPFPSVCRCPMTVQADSQPNAYYEDPFQGALSQQNRNLSFLPYPRLFGPWTACGPAGEAYPGELNSAHLTWWRRAPKVCTKTHLLQNI